MDFWTLVLETIGACEPVVSDLIHPVDELRSEKKKFTIEF